MRTPFLAGLLLCGIVMWARGIAAADDPAPIVRQHFAGLEKVAARPDLGPLRKILAHSETRRVVEEVSRKLALHMPRWFSPDLPAGDPAAAPLQSVVHSLLQAESILEVAGDDGARLTWALAARVGSNRAAAHGAELGRVLAELMKVDPPAAGANSWELKGTGPGAVRVEVDGDWLLLGVPGTHLARLAEQVRQDRAPAMATDRVLDSTIDLRQLAPLLNWPARPSWPVAQWPSVELEVEPRNGRLRSVARFAFSRDLDLNLEAWRLPASLIRDPIVGFTAFQGADRWLSRLPMFAGVEVTDWPRQLFFWSLAEGPWQQYFAGPITGQTNLVSQLGPPLALSFMTHGIWRGQSFGLRLTNQASRVELVGLPYFSPFLQLSGSEDDRMLFGGLFLPNTKGPPPPSDLVNQVVSRTNLVLYDWETSWHAVVTNAPGEPGPRTRTNLFGRPIQLVRLAQWSHTAQRTPSGELIVPGGEWIRSVVPYLGNTVTEVSRTGPAELTAVRQSQVGFNGLELVLLFQWLENEGFPGWIDPPSTKDGGAVRPPTPNN
jgi:hypothetical protein